MFRRRRFAELVARQLAVFSSDEQDGLLGEMREAKTVYDRAGREEAEERYGDYVDVVDAATEALAGMRRRYAETLDDAAVAAYEAEFNRAVRKRWPALGLEIADR